MRTGKPHTRILLAEDEPSAARTMRLMLVSEGYEVDTCLDGITAFEYFIKAFEEASPYQLLITDIQMPGCTGEELVDRINASEIPCRFLAISGFGEKHHVVSLMRKGCQDYLDKPFSDDDLVQSVNRVLQKPLKSSLTPSGELIKASRQVETLSHYVEAFQSEYKCLMEPGLRNLLFPMELRYQAYACLGGDLFQALERDSTLRLLAADVAGHDPGASFLSFLLKTYFEDYLHAPPQEILRKVNSALLAKKSQRMITAVMIELDPCSRHMYYYNAAHMPLMRIPSDNSPIKLLQGQGLPLGFFDDLNLVCGMEKLCTGDRIVVFTDGLTQLSRNKNSNIDNSELGLEGLVALAESFRNLPLHDFTEAIWNHALDAANYRIKDDLLLATVQIT